MSSLETMFQLDRLPWWQVRNVLPSEVDGIAAMLIFGTDGYFRGYYFRVPEGERSGIYDFHKRLIAVQAQDKRIMDREENFTGYVNPIDFLIGTVKPHCIPGNHILDYKPSIDSPKGKYFLC